MNNQMQSSVAAGSKEHSMQRTRSRRLDLVVVVSVVLIIQALIAGPALAGSPKEGATVVAPYALNGTGDECPVGNTTVTCETSASAAASGDMAASTRISASSIGAGQGGSWGFVGDTMLASRSTENTLVANYFIQDASASKTPFAAGFASVYLYVCVRTSSSFPDCIAEDLVTVADTSLTTGAPERAGPCSVGLELSLPARTAKFTVRAYLVTGARLGDEAAGTMGAGEVSASGAATMTSLWLGHHVPPGEPDPPGAMCVTS